MHSCRPALLPSQVTVSLRVTSWHPCPVANIQAIALSAPVTTGSAHLPALSAPTMGTLESANSTQAGRGLPEPGAQAPDCSHFPCQGCRGLQAVLEVFVPPHLGVHLGISTTMSSSKREGECPPSLSDLSCMCLPFPFTNNPPGSRRGVLSAPSSCLTRPLPTSEPPPAPCHPWSYAGEWGFLENKERIHLLFSKYSLHCKHKDVKSK